VFAFNEESILIRACTLEDNEEIIIILLTIYNRG